MRVLVVEDEKDLADAVARGLRREGYAVDVAYDGDSALEKAFVNAYDVLCLDVNLPGTNGRTVARRVHEHYRERNGAPVPRILMLSALGELEDRVAGLDDGADDYLTKPFAWPELAARIRALLRRDGGRSGSILHVGDIELDAGRHVVTRAGRPLKLSPKEFALLHYLMARPGQVLSQ